MERITDYNIKELSKDEVFVFGSNEGGNHGKGAAKTAMKWGAKYGIGEGLMGRTYGIPTKGADLRKSLSLSKISYYVDRFITCAKQQPQLTFLVTAIGTGLAGYTPEQIAPLFLKAIPVENIHLPKSFWIWINKNT